MPLACSKVSHITYEHTSEQLQNAVSKKYPCKETNFDQCSRSSYCNADLKKFLLLSNFILSFYVDRKYVYWFVT